jgi:zinc transporter ZupT
MWLVALLPLVLLAGLILVVVRTGPADVLKSPGVPPVEVLTFQRVQLTPQGIKATVLNDGPDPVTIAQVQVDDAYWHYTVEPKTLLHLRQATLTIPYPWVEGETHRLKVLTSTGVVFEHEIAVAVPTPEPGWRYLGVFTLIGLYVGVVPVMIGLLWYPMVRRLGHRGLDFLLALTVGLLLFLLVDASAEGFEVASGLPGSYQGVTLFVFSAIAAYLALEAIGVWLAKRSSAQRGAGWILALLIALGIGLHNFGEGLAIGAAFALGEAALGSLLIIGFALHNTTEGLAIVVPLAKHTNAQSRVPVRALFELGLLGGVPAIAGAWLGGFVYSQIWALVFLGFGVGAIAQVVTQILGQMARDEPLPQFLANRAVLAGLLAGFVVMYTTGMLIG